MSTANHNPKP